MSLENWWLSRGGDVEPFLTIRAEQYIDIMDVASNEKGSFSSISYSLFSVSIFTINKCR